MGVSPTFPDKCVYTMHAVTATGILSDSVKAEFARHAKEEQAHIMAVAERINQLGGEPTSTRKALPPRRPALHR